MISGAMMINAARAGQIAVCVLVAAALALWIGYKLAQFAEYCDSQAREAERERGSELIRDLSRMDDREDDASHWV